jgi:hypothetical protein
MKTPAQIDRVITKAVAINRTVIAREDRVLAYADLITRRRVFNLPTRIFRCDMLAGFSFGEALAEVEALEAQAKPAAKKPAQVKKAAS